MARKSDWGGAEKFGVGVLAGCLQEKVSENIISLIGASESLLEWVEKSNPDAAKLFRDTIEKAKKELLTQC